VRVEKDDRDLNQALETSLRDSKEIIIQEFIPGRELTCGVIDGGVPNSTFVLPPTEIILAGSPFFDYKTKYAPATMEITPAPIPDSFTQAVKRAALIAHKAVGCCNFSRSDFILSGKDKGKLFILEINTIPGMTENSLIPRAAKAIGMSFPKLLETLVQGALLKK
jgi:D-alanine-D-alanine ligase